MKKENPTVQFMKSGEGARSPRQDSGICERNLNLLAHAQAIELDIGSLCGGHGICGGDRVQVMQPVVLSSLTEAEKKHLTTEEIAQGWRLACQCFPEISNQLIVLGIRTQD